jgi:hypothetical protein
MIEVFFYAFYKHHFYHPQLEGDNGYDTLALDLTMHQVILVLLDLTSKTRE